MIVELAALADEPLEADVCVVGAGAAGLALVTGLAGPARSVVVVESGGEPATGDEDVLNEGEVAAPFNGLRGRARGLGGTMRLWPGQCLPLARDELEPRAWVPESGWPLAWDELARWYPAALEFFGLPRDVFERDVLRAFRLRPPALDPSQLGTVVSAFSPQPDRGRALRPRLRAERDVRVVTGATAVRLVPDESGTRVERVQLRSLGGASGEVAARRVVLCCGGIENARLLLASGIGNEHDTVGRWFQDHVVARVGTVATTEARLLQTVYGVLYRRGLRWYPRLALARPVQEAERVLACGVNLVFETPPAVQAALRAARGVRERRLPARADAALALRGAGDVAAAALRRYARGWSPAPRAAQVRLLLIGEQAPSRDSRVTLADAVDPLGVPLPRVDWRPGELERRTLVTAGEVAERQLRAAGLGELDLDPRLRDPDAWREGVFDSFHHAGGTRMSTDPRRGVVDRDCRVHGFANLFVAGSSVFPSSGFANPTLTIAALALRLADHLERTERQA